MLTAAFPVALLGIATTLQRIVNDLVLGYLSFRATMPALVFASAGADAAAARPSDVLFGKARNLPVYCTVPMPSLSPQRSGPSGSARMTSETRRRVQDKIRVQYTIVCGRNTAIFDPDS